MTVDIVRRLDTLISAAGADSTATDWTTITPLTANPTYATETGDVDIEALTYPDDVDGLTLTINGVSHEFDEPADPAALITELNTAFSSVEFDEVVDGVEGYLRYIANQYGTVTISGSATRTIGLSLGDNDAGWYELGSTSKYIEVGFQDMVCSGTPTTVHLRVWRRDDQTIDMVGEIQIPYASIANYPSQRLVFDGDTLAISVAFTGGTTPAITSGTIRVRAVNSGASASGLSTEAKQDTGNARLASIDSKVTACNTGAVTVSSSALPTGAATETTLGTVHGHVDSIDTKTPAPAFAELIDTTNVDTTTVYYPTTTSDVGVDVSTKTALALWCKLSGGVTLTVEGTSQAAPAAGDWVDVTKSCKLMSTGNTGTASMIDVTDCFLLNGALLKRLRVKVVTSDASNAIRVWMGSY